MQCPHCNATLPDGNQFCGECGKAITPAKKTCPTCGFTNEPEMCFCIMDGTRLDEAPASLPVPSAPVPTPQGSLLPNQQMQAKYSKQRKYLAQFYRKAAGQTASVPWDENDDPEAALRKVDDATLVKMRKSANALMWVCGVVSALGLLTIEIIIGVPLLLALIPGIYLTRVILPLLTREIARREISI